MTLAERSLRRPIMLAVGLGAFLAQLDGTIMNVALPALSRSFRQSGLHAVQPVITTYLIATVVLLPVLGKVADRLGRKRMFLCGFAIFGIASVLCARASSIHALIAFRVAQAAGGALLSSTSLALVAAGSGAKRGHALGRLSIIFALSGLLGPPIGGGLIQAFGWPAVFWLNAPVTVLGFAIAASKLPKDVPVKFVAGHDDLAGMVLFALAAASVAAGTGAMASLTISGFTVGWQLPLVAGGLLSISFLTWEARQQPPKGDPLLNVRLLQNRDYGFGLLAAFLNSGVTIMMFVLVPFWLSHGWHVANGALGAIFLPVALAVGGLSPFAGKQADRLGPRLLTTLAGLTGAAAACLLALQATSLTWPLLVIGMTGLGASIGLFAAPNNSAVLGSVPDSMLASAGSLLTASRTLGVILAVSAGSATFDTLSTTRGPNEAGRVLFLVAACVFLANAALCWITRATRVDTRAGPTRSPAAVANLPRRGL